MDNLELYLLTCFDLGLMGRGEDIRQIVAEEQAEAWKRDSEAAMERRARLNGRSAHG